MYIVCKHIHVHVYAHVQFYEILYKFNYHVTVNYEVKMYLIK